MPRSPVSSNRAPLKATFGPPRGGISPRGAFVSIYLVPEWDGHLIAFDVVAKEAPGRWLPWTIADFGASPWETASALSNEWCGDTTESIELVDTISFETDSAGWELALVFRARLNALPPGETERIPVVSQPDDARLSVPFAAADLGRWIARQASATASGDLVSPASSASGKRLLF